MKSKHLIRTTVRLQPNLKKALDQLALDRQTTVQEILNQAVAAYLGVDKKNQPRKIDFDDLGIDLGVPLDNLTREDYYSEPDMEKYH